MTARPVKQAEWTSGERRAFAKGAAKAEARFAETRDSCLAGYRNAWQALHLVRFALEHVAPAGCLLSEEAVTLTLGPEPIHEGEALAKAVIAMAEKLNKPSRILTVFDWAYDDPVTGHQIYARTPERAAKLQADGVKLTPVFTVDE